MLFQLLTCLLSRFRGLPAILNTFSLYTGVKRGRWLRTFVCFPLGAADSLSAFLADCSSGHVGEFASFASSRIDDLDR